MENYPLNRDDVKDVEDMWGENLGCLSGKTLQRSTRHIRGKRISIPITALQHYHDVTLAGDLMYVNNIHFINAISRQIKFMTAEHIANIESSTLQKSIKQINRIYMKQGFKVIKIPMGCQFSCIRGDLYNM